MKEVQYIVIDQGGNKFYCKNKEMTIYHRTDGPAIEWADGCKMWFFNGVRHREDGPAIEHHDSSKSWWIDGKCHRTDGPAIDYVDGYKEWYINGKLHRTDGPAVEFPTGDKKWYINGVELTKEEFKHEMQPKININGKDFTVEELNELIGAAKGK